MERQSSAHGWATPLVAMAVAGVFVSIIVAGAGSAPWRVARLGIVVCIAAALVHAVRRRRRIAAVPSVILGVVVAATGRAFGVQMQQTRGWSALVVLGCVSYVCGLVLIGWGVWIATSALRGVRRALALLIVLGLVKLVLFDSVVVPVADGLVLANGPRFQLDGQTPADLGIAFESVTFLTPDGLELSGWYLPSDNGAAVVLAHGASSTRSSVLRHAAVLSRHGYGVLMFDARGQGESDGVAMGLGWFGDADLAGAVSFLAGRPDVEPSRIGLVGLSLGGEQAIGAAAHDPRVRAVVAEGASYRVIGDWTPRSESGLVERLRERLTFATAAIASNASTPPTLVRSVTDFAPRRIMLIQSGAGTEIVAGRELAAASPSIELWELPTVGHLGGLDAEPAAWERRVVAFLDTNL